LVERIPAVAPHLDLVYRGLIGGPRYPGDHTAPVSRTAAPATGWAALRGQGFDGWSQRHAVDM
jgi:hypothetical protein